MKRFFIYIIGIGLLLTACDMESSDNGHLDGFWQMTSKTDQYAKRGAVDMRDSGITWAFQGKLLELRDVKKVHQDILEVVLGSRHPECQWLPDDTLKCLRCLKEQHGS